MLTLLCIFVHSFFKEDCTLITYLALTVEILLTDLAYFQGLTLTRNAHLPGMYQLEAAFLLVLVTVPKW